MLLAIIDDIVMLALAVAVAAVVLICILLGLYIWALKRQRKMDEPPSTSGLGDEPPGDCMDGPGRAD